MWKPTLGKYEVSDDGRVRNAHTGREIKQFIGKDGYARTQIAGKSRLVHRVIAKAYIPEEPEKPFVNHKDGNKQNNSVDNLEWVTRAENIRHAYINDLMPTRRGVRNGRCKLTEEQVEYIKTNYVAGDRVLGAKALSLKFGVARQTISAVACGQNWKEKQNESNQ